MRNRVTCPECRKVIAWPIDNPAGPFCPECGGLISVVDNKPTERAPMLSDEEMIELADQTEYKSKAAENVRDFYEAKITSGELRAVKKATLIQPDELVPLWFCSECDWRNTPSHYAHCPGCGAQIVKE